MTRPFAPALAMLALALAIPCAHSQPAGALGEDFIHVVQAGDTLSTLAQRYTGDASNWQPLQTHNGVADPTRLPVAMELHIPLALIPEQAASARVVHVQGRAEVDGRLAQPDMAVAEGMRLRTYTDSFLSLELADGSTVTIPAGSDVSVERLRQFRAVPLTDSVLHIRAGTVDARVAPAGQGVGRFEIRAPVAVTGVRGTRLRVRTQSDGVTSQVMEGHLRVQPHAPGALADQPVVVASGYGAVVRGDGSLAGVRPLLPAPRLDTPRRSGGTWHVAFAPVAGAAAYELDISTDPQALRVVSSRRIEGPQQAGFAAPGAGRYYVTVRAVDDQGLTGHHATRPFTGTLALMSSDGQPVAAGYGATIMLTLY